MNIYAGNLSYELTEEELRDAFEEYGAVSSVTILQDRETGRSRGVGFVEMPSDEEARAAIAALDGKEVGGRALRVNEARPREQRPSGGGFRGGSGGDRGPRRDFNRGGSRGGNQRGGGRRYDDF